jgi:hypothetical protein
MKLRILPYICLVALMLTALASCIREEDYDNDAMGNFNQLWTIIDEQYCFLDYKEIDWDAVGAKYRKRISESMNNENLFEVMDSMLYELKDGHVNLTSSFNQTHYDFWTDSPRNYNEAIIESDRYLGSDYRRAAGLKYKILSDNIGYISYTSFSSAVGDGNLDQALSHMAVCNGLIIDVRQNGGGDLTYSDRISSRFTNEKVLTGYMCHKTGKGHSDFSDPYPVYIESSNGVRWQKPVVVLANRHSYSATNDFVRQMKCMPNVVIMGDKTGGGSGLPFTSELPNGWSIRFSASPTFDCDMNQTEWGIEPDIKVDMDEADEAKGVDTMIEAARTYLTELTQNWVEQ